MSRIYNFADIRCHYLDHTGYETSLNMFRERCQCTEMITLDLETTGLDPYTSLISIVGVGIYDQDGWQVFLFDCCRFNWSDILRPVLENKNIWKVVHNAKFDWKFLYHYWAVDTQPLLDTMQTGQILDNGLGRQKKGYYSLAEMAERMLEWTMDKDESLRQSFQGGAYSERQLRYVTNDLVVPALLWDKLYKKLDASLYEIVKLEAKCIPPVASMELNGFLIDQNKLESLEIKIMNEMKEIELRLPVLSTPDTARSTQLPLFSEISFSDRLNPNSPK